MFLFFSYCDWCCYELDVQVFVWMCISHSLKYIGMKLLSHGAIIDLTFWQTARVFSKMAGKIFPANITWGFYFLHILTQSVQFSSVAQSCPTPCDPLNCSTPGLPVHHQLPEFTQTHVHWVGRWCHPTISPSVIPFFSHLQSFPATGPFPVSQLFASGGQSIGVSASASILPMNIQDWFPLGLTSLISLQSKWLSRVFSNTIIQSINSSVFSFLYGPSLTSIHDYWKNHKFDYMDLCWQSDVSAF